MLAKETSKVEETDSTVFIGKKPVMNYVIACMTSFNGGADKVVIKARGRAISRAIDTVELLRRAFVKNVNVGKIDIGTEELMDSDNRKSNVSTMEITLTKTE